MHYPSHIIEIAKSIKLLVLDVDGVLTPGNVMLTHEGTEIKTFNSQDGYGMKHVQRHGVTVAIISGRQSAACTKRMHELGIEHVHQGVHDKVPVFENLIQTLNLEEQQCAYMGDDVPDMPIMRRVALKIAVANATQPVKQIANWHTTRHGGHGAVREACDLLMTAQQMVLDYVT